jgi:serine phosphatase RsbU (regulator of sigma subunit)
VRFPPVLRHLRIQAPLRDLVYGLTARQLLPLALAISALFSILGPVTDVMAGGRQPGMALAVNSVLAAALALGYAFGSMRRNPALLVAAVVLQVLWLGIGPRLFEGLPSPAASAVPARLNLDGVLTLVAVVISYVCFLWFINGTATRYLAVRAEMELAHQIHAVLVPPVATTVGEFEFRGFSFPSGEVGGDLVDVVPSLSLGDFGDAAAGGHAQAWFGYVADVSGHGVSSGVVMGMFKSAVRMRLLDGGPLSALLDDLNMVLFPLKSSAMYVTTSCVRGSGTGGTLDYAVAGHLPILHVHAATREVEEVTTPQIPIGMFEDYRFSSGALTCERGDLLALITDGLTEVFDTEDRELGIDAIKGLLRESATLPLAQAADLIVATARAHGRQIDDQTLLLIRRLG